MRAMDIAFFLIILQASIGLVNGMGIFDANTTEMIQTPDNPYMEYNLETLNDSIGNPDDMGTVDYFVLSVKWAWESLFMFLKIALAVVFILPMLIQVFGVPPVLATFLQIGVYVIYIKGFVQFKSNRSFRSFE